MEEAARNGQAATNILKEMINKGEADLDEFGVVKIRQPIGSQLD